MGTWVQWMLPAMWLLSGCQQTDYTFVPYVDPNLGIQSRLIELDPPVLDFGHVEARQSATHPVIVRNIGLDWLYIEGVKIEGYGSFEASQPSVTTLPPGAEATVDITYSPIGFERATASLVVTSSDPVIPSLSAGLAGRCSPPVIRLVPPNFDFGLAYIGCGLTQPIEVHNDGEGDLHLDVVKLNPESDAFSWVMNPSQELPVIVHPGEFQAVDIGWQVGDVGGYETQLHIESNDPDRPVVTANMYGEGLKTGLVSDRFHVDKNNLADILFVVDNSSSMAEEQDTLVCNFSDYQAILEEQDIDYHIGVITTDNPGLQGEEKVITPETPDPYAAFRDNVLVGYDGNTFEVGLEMALQALSFPLVDSQNQGFLRPNASLRVIFISDEDDHSQGQVPEYIEFLASLKPDPGQVVASAIIGDPQTGCGSPPQRTTSPSSDCPQQSCGSAAPGSRYAEVVNSTGGILASICSCNFAAALEDLAYTTVTEIRTFLLTQNPIADTLSVTVNGKVSGDWAYDPSINAVVFDFDNMPPPDSDVVAEYQLAAFCED